VVKNTGTVPIAYITETTVWYGGAHYVPDVATGTPGEKFGIIAPGAEVDVTGFVHYVLLGSSLPFSVPGVRTILDEATIPWPPGVPGSGGATMMQLAEIEVYSSCTPVDPLW
jgi:hypothetical protein